MLKVQVLKNSGSQMFMLRVKILSVLDCHWRNSRGTWKELRKHSSNVSPQTGSVPREMFNKPEIGPELGIINPSSNLKFGDNMHFKNI